MKYAWKEGSRWPIPAQEAGEVIETLKREGRIDPEEVVESASSRRSPIHTAFEWDDGIAAHQHRLETARLILRTLVITVQTEDKQIVTRAFVHITGKDDQDRSISFYTPVYDAMSDSGQRAYLLDKAMRELKAWRERYKDLKEVADLISILNAHII